MARSIQDLIDLEFAEQQARDYERFMKSRQPGWRQPDHREAATFLQISPAVEATRANVVPIGVSEAAPVKPEAYCKYCGKLFKAKTVGMAKMQKNRHEKKDHSGQSSTT